MLRTLIIASFAYFVFSYLRKKIFTTKTNLDPKKDQSYKNLDIKDADFEDIDND
jgi:hypothetical protein|tara:strand:- start:490 stop:651 length:162 start_codon:yes stop_codon:yes gene_type:complete